MKIQAIKTVPNHIVIGQTFDVVYERATGYVATNGHFEFFVPFSYIGTYYKIVS